MPVARTDGRTATVPVGYRAPVHAPRIRWVDTAKAIAIVLVALAHAVQWTTLSGLSPDLWNRVNVLLVLFRMPLFFLASGLFASSVIRRPWPVLWRSRLSLLVWVLLVWTLVRFAYFSLVPDASGLDHTDPVDLALTPLMPSNGLWFLFASGFFFVVLKLLDGVVTRQVQLGGAAVLAVVFFTRVDTGSIAWNGVGRYLLFFMVGCYARDRIVTAVESRSALWALALGAVFLLMAVPAFALQSRLPGVTGVLVIASAAVVGTGLLLARRLDRTRHLGWVATVGRHTLPVYVLHVLFVSAITTSLTHWRGSAWLTALGPVLPLLVSAVAVAASLGTWRVTRDLPGLQHLYAVPRWFSGAGRATPSEAPRPGASGSTDVVDRL